MMLKKSISLFALATALGSVSAPSFADVDLVVKVAPPAPRVETVPAARVGYVWTPGYWDYRDNQYVWVGGRHEKVRTGYTYVSPVWVQKDGGWHLQRGQWRAGGDKDNDGVKNAYDKDRDGDGVRNSRDKHPNSPNS